MPGGPGSLKGSHFRCNNDHHQHHNVNSLQWFGVSIHWGEGENYFQDLVYRGQLFHPLWRLQHRLRGEIVEGDQVQVVVRRVFVRGAGVPGGNNHADLDDVVVVSKIVLLHHHHHQHHHLLNSLYEGKVGQHLAPLPKIHQATTGEQNHLTIKDNRQFFGENSILLFDNWPC